ncbi:MAG: Ribosomal RNA small subunit methyltransferase E [Alphaproteobacteria bacterium MarineAlpha5_Bin9]|nr:MAG: Ribosomal RNA small subunit methyltransferase E [Alphaproteobacteria bacterium MarineAlpha5_Bin9]|tara:strand:- start:4378 stop:5109 length:732 start_codon:yes stop_codon:yes gene_type:complete
MEKSKTRIYIPNKISPNLLIYVKDKKHHYLKNVLRVKIGNKINIFDGITGEWLTEVMSINKNNTVLKIKSQIKNFQPSADVWLIFSPIKFLRMNIAIQKATELGVSKIIPCITEFTNIRNININNWKANSIEASEQSERIDIPIITKEIKLDDLFKNWPKDRSILFCDEKKEYKNDFVDHLIKYRSKMKKWAIIIGPEGGFSNIEREIISSFDKTVSFSMGEKILRTDTAITVALYCVHQLIN